MLATTTSEQHGAPASVEEEQLRGITRIVGEIHWLLLTLVLLYLIFGGVEEERDPSILGAFLYAVFFISFRYVKFRNRESRAKIAVETWGMIAFITWVLWFTGKLDSPLLGAYLLAVITASLTLGKLTTFFEVGLIAACFVFLGASESTENLTSLVFIRAVIVQLAPVLIVAYVTTMFSGDIRYGFSQVKAISETDPLTGMLNMRGFAGATGRLFGIAQRHTRPASVVMFDSDNLKPVNDIHGHEAGNTMLKMLAMTIKKELRETDVPARYGGDEFIAFLPDTPSTGALDVAERIRAAVAAMRLASGSKLIETSVSVGVASFPEDGQSIDALVVLADRAMYNAKRQGRNRVCHQSVEIPLPQASTG